MDEFGVFSAGYNGPPVPQYGAGGATPPPMAPQVMDIAKQGQLPIQPTMGDQVFPIGNGGFPGQQMAQPQTGQQGMNPLMLMLSALASAMGGPPQPTMGDQVFPVGNGGFPFAQGGQQQGPQKPFQQSSFIGPKGPQVPQKQAAPQAQGPRPQQQEPPAPGNVPSLPPGPPQGTPPQVGQMLLHGLLNAFGNMAQGFVNNAPAMPKAGPPAQQGSLSGGASIQDPRNPYGHLGPAVGTPMGAAFPNKQAGPAKDISSPADSSNYTKRTPTNAGGSTERFDAKGPKQGMSANKKQKPAPRYERYGAPGGSKER